MNSELVAALAGAIVGAVLTGVLGYLQTRWTRKLQTRSERERQRLNLVREIMRHRLDQARLLGPLNELPLTFGDDGEVLRLYRETLNATTAEARTHALTALINSLAKLVDLSPSVQVSDIQRGFRNMD